MTIAAVKDLYSKEIVGYALNKRMTADLVYQALNNAIKFKRPAHGLIVHSDRGSQYYSQIIEKHRFAGSMSRKGHCYDNAPIESFWGQFKNELIYHKVYETRQQAILDVTRYVEIFYNRQRIQKELGFKSPTQSSIPRLLLSGCLMTTMCFILYLTAREIFTYDVLN